MLLRESFFTMLKFISFQIPYLFNENCRVKEELGACFRLRKEIVNIFSAIFTIYSPMDMNSTLLFDQPSTNLPSQLL